MPKRLIRFSPSCRPKVEESNWRREDESWLYYRLQVGVSTLWRPVSLETATAASITRRVELFPTVVNSARRHILYSRVQRVLELAKTQLTLMSRGP